MTVGVVDAAEGGVERANGECKWRRRRSGLRVTARLPPAARLWTQNSERRELERESAVIDVAKGGKLLIDLKVP